MDRQCLQARPDDELEQAIDVRLEDPRKIILRGHLDTCRLWSPYPDNRMARWTNVMPQQTRERIVAIGFEPFGGGEPGFKTPGASGVRTARATASSTALRRRSASAIVTSLTAAATGVDDQLAESPAHARARVEIDAQLVRMIEVVGAHWVGIQVDAPEVHHPQKRGRVAHHDLSRRRTRRKAQLFSIHSGRCSGACFWRMAAPSTKRLSTMGRPAMPRSAPSGPPHSTCEAWCG